LADAWINQGRCKYVLAGTIDELSPAMEYICEKKLNISKNGKRDPFSFSDNSESIPGEGSAFFLLGKDDGSAGYCSINLTKSEAHDLRDVDLCIVESDGCILNESPYKDVGNEMKLFNSSSVFGGITSGTSFHCASGALMLKEGRVFEKHIKDSLGKEEKNLSRIACLKYGCDNDKSIVSLTKQSS